MKKSIIVISALALFFAGSIQAQSWRNINIQESMFIYYDQCFPSYSIGYRVGTAGIIEKTFNAGDTWERLEISGLTYDLTSVSFVNDNTGYIVGGNGSIYKTIDGGVNWTKHSYGGYNLINDCYFINANTGFACINNGAVIKTMDGGVTWSLQNNVSTENLLSIFFINATTGFMSGTNGAIIKTTDAGTTWSSTATGITTSLNNIYFTTIDTGFAIGGAGTLLKTFNGGTTWTNSLQIGGPYLRSIHFYNSKTGVIAGHGIILSTSDGGINWTKQPLQPEDKLTCITINSATTGYACGATSIEYTSGNLSQNWIKTITNTTSLNAVYFYDSLNGYIVGNNGTIYKSTTKGDSWQHIPINNYINLNAIVFTDVNNGIIVGNNGTILKTTTSGLTWHATLSNTTEILNDVFFTTTTTGFAVGSNGVILKTVDSGENWTSLNSPTTLNLESIFINGNNGVAVGTGGILLNSNDAGNTWITASSGVAVELKSINFNYATTGFIVGSVGTLLKTTDAGKTWTSQTLAGNKNLTSIYFTNDTVGYISSITGIAYTTTNGGNTWQEMVTGSSQNLNAITGVKENEIIAVGDNMTILKYASISNQSKFNFTIDAIAKTVSLVDSSVNATNYYWELGNGKVSMDKDPLANYNKGGYYRISQSILDASTGLISKSEKVVYINDGTIDCEAEFSYSIDTYNTTVQFNNTSLGDSYLGTHLWDFGDGDTSAKAFPQHKFIINDFFNVCLTVTNNGCKNITCKLIKSGADTIAENASFLYVTDKTSNTIIFNDKSINATKWNWDFGDGTSSTTQNPQHIYADTGLYHVILEINTAKYASQIFNALVNVHSTITTLQASFISKETKPIAKGVLPIEFRGIGYGDASEVEWDFGDGTTCTSSMTPIHEYAQPGKYKVCMSVYDSLAFETFTYCDSVEIGLVGINHSSLTINNSDFDMYPNPASQSLVVSIKSLVNTNTEDRITITNTLGQTVFTNYYLLATNYSIDVSQLKSGVYFVRVNNTVKKLIVNK